MDILFYTLFYFHEGICIMNFFTVEVFIKEDLDPSVKGVFRVFYIRATISSCEGPLMSSVCYSDFIFVFVKSKCDRRHSV